MADRHLAARLRNLARIVRGERAVKGAAMRALEALLAYAATALRGSGYDPSVLDDRAPQFRAALRNGVLPAIEAVFLESFAAASRGVLTADPYATRHLETVWNRLVGVSDETFDVMRSALAEGRLAGEGIPQLAGRVDALLADSERWANRATTIARTEVIGANNAGSYDGARATADFLGVAANDVARTWLATGDGRTRPSHAEAEGQVVIGMDTPYSVGADQLMYPGDPAGAAEEVINCVVGSTQVAWPGQHVRAATRRSYSGEFIEVRTARDHYLTVTPNHPILTTGGYVPAQSLRPGQHVLATLTPPAPEVEDGPPSIEQVQRAALQVGSARRVSGTAVDFHGDGTDTEVEVVRPDRNLTLYGDAKIIREPAQKVLVSLRGAPGTSAGSRPRHRRLGLHGVQSPWGTRTPDGSVSSSGALATLSRSHTGGTDPVSLTGGTNGQTQGLQPPYDQAAANTEVTGHLQDALTLGMTPCEVIEVNRFHGTHDVFNLQTSDAWYIGNGIAQHNCRCVELFSYPGDPDYPGLTAGGNMSTSLHPRPRGLTAAADDDEQTSVVVVALPAADDPVHGIGAEQKHATVLFFGSLDPEDDMHNPQLETYRSLLDDVLGIVAAETAPFTEDVSGVESLGDDGARVWMLAGDHLPGVRDELLEVDLELVGVLEAVEQYPTYTPHVTIGYPAADPDTAPEGDRVMLDPDTEAAAADVASITFDRLALWWAGEQVEYPLTTQQEAPVETEPTEASAGTVLLARREGGDAEADLTATAEAMAEAFGWDFNTAAEALQRALTDPVPSPSPWTLTTHAPLAPGEAPAGGPGLAQDIAADGEPWYGILCPEGVLSGDARQFSAGAITWRDLPLPLMYQDATALGHDGAVRVGRIDSIERDETGTRPMIRAAGVWDTSEAALEARRQVGVQVLRGVSVDCDAVTVEYMGSDGQVLDPMVDDFPEDGVVIENATAARIAGGTLCSVPAFHQAYIANGTLADRTEPEPGQAEVGADAQPPQTADETVAEAEAIAASAWQQLREQAGDTGAPAWSLTAAAVVAAVPFSDFTRPDVLDTYADGYPLAIVGERIYGHLAAWGQCHIGVDGLCQEPPASMSGYAHYAVGSVPTDQGRVHVGQLTMDTGHAPMHLAHRPAAAHYDNTGVVVADIAVGEDHIGIWYSGRLRPGITDEQRHAIQASGKVSGDWREAVRGSGQLELVAALLVNVHGFSIPRPAIAASGGRLTALVASGIVDRPLLTSLERDQVALVRQLTASVLAALSRTTMHADATVRLRRVRAMEAARRLERIH